jgi:hypothetical protein
MKRVEEMAATKCAGVKVILKEGKIIGKIIIAYPKDGAGVVHVNFWDWSDKNHTPEVQYGRASGYGYDKVSAAIAGMKFAGKKLTDHPYNYEWCLRDLGFEVYTLL